MTRKKLSDILTASARTNLTQTWANTEAASERGPLPRGEYIARVVEGGPTRAFTGTPGYKLTFEVIEGEFAGRRFWHDLWLTPAAMPMTKRDLAKFGITSLDQLDQPLPRGIRCRVQLVLREDDDGTRRNQVRHFEALGVDPPERDPFAPTDDLSAEGGPESPAPLAPEQPGGPTL